jgi:four helix bundle protein
MSGAERHEDLLVWRLAFDLSVDIWKVTARPPANRDFKFTSQIRDSSDSAQRNVAEGFARYNPLEFARFLDIARASATETKSLLQKGRAVGLLPDDDFERLFSLNLRGLQALARFQRYLRSPEASRKAKRRYLRSNDSNNSNDSND